MTTNLLTCGELGIPEAVTHAHDELRAALARATAEPGPVGAAAKHLAELCVPYFDKEEKDVFRVFGLLDDLLTDRARPDRAVALPVLAELRGLRDSARDRRHLIDAAIQELLQRASEANNRNIAGVADALKRQEKVEDEVMYPAILLIDQSLRESLGG
ncbi:MAG: hemerythrin domain-containing protein [Burkholderiales bacterium]|nr:hemerythrin domain-containing protein [Burkholderiales bacterium]